MRSITISPGHHQSNQERDIDRIGKKQKRFCATLSCPPIVLSVLSGFGVVYRHLQNEEVIGSDESFFEDQGPNESLNDLYHEKSASLMNGMTVVDLSSYAYEAFLQRLKTTPNWKKSSDNPMCHTSKPHHPTGAGEEFSPDSWQWCTRLCQRKWCQCDRVSNSGA